MDLFFSSILLLVALFVILGLVMGFLRNDQGECDADEGFDDMKPVAAVSMILIAILTLFLVFKIIKIIVKKIQIKRGKK